MRTICLFNLPAIVLIVLVAGQLTGQIPLEAALEKLNANRMHHAAMAYDVVFRAKLFSTPAATTYKGKVEQERVPGDTLFGGYLSLDMDSLWFGYDGRQIMKAIRPESRIAYADPVEDPYYAIKGNIVQNLIDDGFLERRTILLDILDDPTIRITHQDTGVGDRTCLAIEVLLPDQGEFTGQRYFMIIDTSLGAIAHKTMSVNFQGDEQRFEWDYGNVKFGQHAAFGDFNPGHLESYATIEIVRRDPGEGASATLPLEPGRLRGRLLGRQEAFDMAAVEANYVILDFWYAACYPCIKSIPHINQVHAALKDKDVAVYGVNPIDKSEKDAARLEKFMRNNAMDYPTIMPDADILDVLNVPGYPTFLVLDAGRNVIYSSTGYSETLFEELMAFLGPHLK